MLFNTIIPARANSIFAVAPARETEIIILSLRVYRKTAEKISRSFSVRSFSGVRSVPQLAAATSARSSVERCRDNGNIILFVDVSLAKKKINK